jgi:hypothetical protein
MRIAWKAHGSAGKILPAANVGGGWAGLFNSSSSNPAAVSTATGQVSPLALIYKQPGFDLFAVSKDGQVIHTDLRETDPTPQSMTNWRISVPMRISSSA